MRNWRERHISETGNRSMEFSDQKSWAKRTPEEMARLDFLRRKQQPHVDWDVDWDNFELRDDISPKCAIQAGKAIFPGERGVQDAVITTADEREVIRHIWETYRLKAVLRSGKTLPYALMKRIGPASQWKTVSRWIDEAGDLPGLSYVVLAAVQEVKNQGYRDALDEILANDIPKAGSSAERRQNRALDLVSNILKAWEAQDRKWDAR